MNLQRISECAENQEGKQFLFHKGLGSLPSLHSEVFA